MSIEIDQTVYPDLDQPPDALDTSLAKADYVHRICTAWDFGVHPEQATFDLFSGWREVFDTYPVLTSAGYHAFRAWFGWPALEPPLDLPCATPRWVHIDRLEERADDPSAMMI